MALGGGVVGDMAGFAAATWLRGIGVVQVPTTLLAMVDAAIGGKTGVNHPGGKNLIGAFHQPKLVLIDPAVLATLPEREFRAGMAEVIKYGVIGDGALFTDLETAARRDPLAGLASRSAVGADLLQRLLERSAAAKARVVAADEREGGLRAILNYGHTIGHAVETLTGYDTYLHGEAVGLGMLAAGEIAREMDLWSDRGSRPPGRGDRRCRTAAEVPLPGSGGRAELPAGRQEGAPGPGAVRAAHRDRIGADPRRRERGGDPPGPGADGIRDSVRLSAEEQRRQLPGRNRCRKLSRLIGPQRRCQPMPRG